MTLTRVRTPRWPPEERLKIVIDLRDLFHPVRLIIRLKDNYRKIVSC